MPSVTCGSNYVIYLLCMCIPKQNGSTDDFLGDVALMHWHVVNKLSNNFNN